MTQLADSYPLAVYYINNSKWKYHLGSRMDIQF